jgi:aryl-alcohol dehydrogenase-like predicted oxidoreductase
MAHMPLPLLPFGRTGHQSTRVIFGGAALARASQAEADRALEVLLEHQVNHIDVAASYGDAEPRIAPWLRTDRQRFFVGTKTNKRTAQEARDELQRSLDRMGIDSVDLWQMHNLVDPIEWDRALSPGGALEAAVQAREEGLVKAIGVTGHGAQIAATHRRSLERFDFDSVLLPYNFPTLQSEYYRANFDALQATCQSRNTAVQTIKSMAYRPWSGREHTSTTWYQPLSEQADIDLAMAWALGRQGIFVITAGDLELLPKVLDAAERAHQQPGDADMRALVERLEMVPLFV